MESAELLKRNAVPESLTRLGFKIRTFDPLPEGFNPFTATNRQLADYGLPRRPDAQIEAVLRRRWERAMTQTKTWITPEFATPPADFPGTSPPEAVAVPDVNPPMYTSPNWSGAVQFSGGGATYTWVAGKWTTTAPNLTNYDGNAPEPWYEATWIGIDGYTSPDVLQAGTTTYVPSVLGGPVVFQYAWWCWFPAKLVVISNLRVSPGDVMYCLICVQDNTDATVQLSNLTTGVATRFAITPPKGTTLAGDSAEWIVERPGTSAHHSTLPDYVMRYFDECAAGYTPTDGSQGSIEALDGAALVTMVNAAGDALSSPTIENDILLRMDWSQSS